MPLGPPTVSHFYPDDETTQVDINIKAVCDFMCLGGKTVCVYEGEGPLSILRELPVGKWFRKKTENAQVKLKGKRTLIYTSQSHNCMVIQLIKFSEKLDEFLTTIGRNVKALEQELGRSFTGKESGYVGIGI